MNPRVLFAVIVGLVGLAFGGFYIALAPHANDAVLPPHQAPPIGSSPVAPAPVSPQPSQPAPPVSQSPASLLPVQPPPPPAPAPAATADSVEAEMALSEYADLLAFLKKNFSADYSELVAAAVRRRNEGVSDQAFGQELGERVQTIMRGRLKFGVGATMPTLDKLAANEAALFHALGTVGAPFCLKMLGKDDTPATGALPDSIRQMMNLGTLYRFQAIVEGMPNVKPVEALKTDEMKAFEASLAREGLNYKDISTGAYIRRGDGDPGKPCLALETLHLAIARLPEGSRRKIYAGMFFIGRDK